MKQIKILLSSVLTLLLITGNNVSYASPHIRDFGPKFKANKPNINTFKGQARKGNRFVPDGRNDGKVTLKRKALPNRNSGGRLYNNGAFRERESGFNQGLHNNGAFRERESGFSQGLHNNGAFLPWHRGVNKFHGNSSGDPLPIRVGKEKNALIPNPAVTLIPNPAVTLKGMVQMPQESQIGETGKNRVHMDLENEEVFPKVELGPDVVTTFDQKTNQVWTNGNATSANGKPHTARKSNYTEVEWSYFKGQEVIKSTGAFDIAPVGKDGFTASSEEQHISGKDGVLGGQESEAFNPTSKYSISDEEVIIPKPDGLVLLDNQHADIHLKPVKLNDLGPPSLTIDTVPFE